MLTCNLKQYMGDSNVATTEQLRQQSIATYRPVEDYRLWKEAFLQSSALREWEEQYSCPFTIIGSRHAVHVGYIRWQDVERFFNLLAWAGEPPHYAKGINDCFVQHGGVRISWAGSFVRVDAPGIFVLLPTSVATDVSLGGKFQNYRNQCGQPPRIRLKPFDTTTVCKNFEAFAKPLHPRNGAAESPEEFEFRILQTLVKIFDHARTQVLAIAKKHIERNACIAVR